MEEKDKFMPYESFGQILKLAQIENEFAQKENTTLSYNSVALRLFWELRHVYPTGADIPFETFAKTDVGLSDAEYRIMNKTCDLSVNDIAQDNRLKEIICCEMHQLQIYFSENFENGKEELEKCLINDLRIPSTQIEEMRNTGYFNDWISGLDEKDR